MSMPGPLELLLILLIILLIFGANKLPEVGRSLGNGIREFMRAVKGEDSGKEEKKEKKD